MNRNNKDYDIKKEFKKDWYVLIIIAALFIVGILTYPFLPDQIASHWNLKGEVDDYMGKFMGTFLLPFLCLFIYGMMLATPLIDPRKENYGKFKKGYRFIRIGMILFFAGLYLVTIAFNLGYKIDVGKMVTLGLGVLFIIMGNYLPQVRHNYFMGIKVPWTLASEKIWRKTHRLAGKLYLFSGIIILFSVFLGDVVRFWLLMILLIGSSLAATVYSYIIYQREERK